MIQRATTQWKSIGTELLTKKNDTAQLGIIQAANSTSHKQCCYDMFEYWLLNYPNAMWEDLLKALRSSAVGHNALAAEVEKGMYKVVKSDQWLFICTYIHSYKPKYI